MTPTHMILLMRMDVRMHKLQSQITHPIPILSTTHVGTRYETKDEKKEGEASDS